MDGIKKSNRYTIVPRIIVRNNAKGALLQEFSGANTIFMSCIEPLLPGDIKAFRFPHGDIALFPAFVFQKFFSPGRCFEQLGVVSFGPRFKQLFQIAFRLLKARAIPTPKNIIPGTRGKTVQLLTEPLPSFIFHFSAAFHHTLGEISSIAKLMVHRIIPAIASCFISFTPCTASADVHTTQRHPGCRLPA